jgi:hypothetical protein
MSNFTTLDLPIDKINYIMNIKFLKHLMIIIISLIICNESIAQKTSNVSASITGSAMITTDGVSVFYNMGGPGIKITKDKWMVGISMLPSLRYFKDDPRPIITPILGGGVSIGYKRLMIGFPLYYIAAKAQWIVSAGLGVKLGK